MLSSRVRPISNGEFMQMFQRCVAPTGWKSKIAVANSGGPDSTCLLFLINRLIVENTFKEKNLPSKVVSLTVDHRLQASSSSMAEQCSAIASLMAIEHHTLSIPWAKAPFPENPSGLGSLEQTARLARYHMLFEAMMQVDANTIAFGHHADDQVETSLMRVARGTTEVGAGGMRPVRRWGMGLGHNNSSLGWAGHEGMSRWIIRPLLEVSKDRVLATCDENDLQYVTDSTNFQPSLTLRNAIRQMLERTDRDSALALSGHDPNLPTRFKEDLEKIQESSKSFSLDISAGREQLRASVKRLSSRVEDVDFQATYHLKKRTLSSPTGTFLLSTQGLSDIEDETVRNAMVLRIMRYVSFHPWGSLRGDGNRRSSSIQRIVGSIWCPNPWKVGIGRFTAGGGVQWQPVSVQYPEGHMLLPDQVGARGGPRDSHSIGWIAARTNPPKSMVQSELYCDITELLSEGLAKRVGMVEVLYDCRFLIQFDMAKIPQEVTKSLKEDGPHTKLLILPETVWHWPKVQWLRDEKGCVVLARVGTQSGTNGSESWIKIDFIRTLDAY